MQIPVVILNAGPTFHAEWGHPRLAPLEYSEVYSLYPLETIETPSRANWPDLWPLADRPGVYLILGPKMHLLHVGKSGTLGRRLSNYFRWSAGKGSPCRVVHTGWETRPMFVATIAVAESFEAAALEEYLIARVRPEENCLGWQNLMPNLKFACKDFALASDQSHIYPRPHLYERPLSQKQTITELDTDYVFVTATVRDTAQLEWWLRGFGSLVLAIEPADLQLRIHGICLQMQ
jgi:hypothetical protein